ncbi:MAG: MBOAT family protein [Lachnospiraceae bacterium]|nr:MBOAT family protein [Lachnospiraceae bacterium]
MVFSSAIFLFGFLPFVLLIYYVVLKKKRKAQNVFLFLSSIIFYAWGEPVFVCIMLLSILINWILGLLIDKYRNKINARRIVIALTVIYNISVLFIFKYLSFVWKNLNLIIKSDHVINIALPIGISFFTFQCISYVIDVYRGKGKAQKNILNVGLYIAFFPQLIAGPIVRYETIAEQIEGRTESLDLFSQGVRRFVYGLGKKVVLANSLAIIAEAAFDNTEGLEASMAWLGIIAYTMQIFFDFSGYSDMAIGLGKMFGFNFNENFNYPYISKSITEFWRRWHISLGTWFRDYVYIPLGGNRVSKARHIFNLFCVWSLTGIWHGANWTFLLWGIMYFVLLVIEKEIGVEKISKLKVFNHIYTLFFVMIGWVFFNSAGIKEALSYIGSMFGRNGIDINSSALFLIKENIIVLLLAVTLCMPVKNVFEKINSKFRKIAEPVLFIILMIVVFSYVVKGGYNPFIYFNF